MTDKVKLKKRHKAIRSRITGTKERPRLVVFRSSKHIYAQLIDDNEGKVILSGNDFSIKTGEKGKITIAFELGREIAKKAKEKKIDSVVFDRGGYLYHGRVKAVAEGARKEGLKF